MSTMLLSVASLSLLLQGGVLRVDSREQGRTFYVDTDRSEIRQALRDVSAPSPAGEMPVWLGVYPGATPWPQRGPNTRTDVGIETLISSDAPDVVFGHYESRIRATAGVKLTYINRQAGRGGSIHAEDGTRRATLSVSPGPRGTSITFNWQALVVRPVPLAKFASLVAVWYDDTKQILRLRDPATNKEYELPMWAMLRYARSVPLEPSARTDFPPWMAFYPDAKVIVANAPPAGWRPTTATDMRTYKVELTTPASVAQVGAFYKATMQQHGLTIVSETESGARGYSFEARSADRMHQVYLNVNRSANHTRVTLMDHYTLPRP